MDRPATFAERLNSIIEMKHITKAELSRMTGISKSSLTRYTKGDWEGKQDAVYAIAQALHVSEAWLMGYDVPMQRIELPEAFAAEEKYSAPQTKYREALYDYVASLIETTEDNENKGVLELFYGFNDQFGNALDVIRQGFLSKNPGAKHEDILTDKRLATLIIDLESRNPKERTFRPKTPEAAKLRKERMSSFDFELYVLIEKIVRLSPQKRNLVSEYMDTLK